jgi:hypothetical protein
MVDGIDIEALLQKDDEVYEVERLVSVREENDARLYEVKWKGWSSKHNTMEPAAHILGSLVDRFERKEAARLAQEEAGRAQAAARRAARATPQRRPARRARAPAKQRVEEQQQSEWLSTSDTHSSDQDEGGGVRRCAGRVICEYGACTADTCAYLVAEARERLKCSRRRPTVHLLGLQPTAEYTAALEAAAPYMHFDTYMFE